MSDKARVLVENGRQKLPITLVHKNFLGKDIRISIPAKRVIDLPPAVLAFSLEFWFEFELDLSDERVIVNLQNASANWEGTIKFSYTDKDGAVHELGEFREGNYITIPSKIIGGNLPIKATVSIG